jgi:PDZ domain
MKAGSWKMSSAGASHSGARWTLIALCAAACAIRPAPAHSQSTADAATSPMAVVAPGTTIPPVPGTDAPPVRVAAGPDTPAVVGSPPQSNTKLPPTTTEIPALLPQGQDSAPPPAAAPDVSNQSADIYKYETQPSPVELQRQLQSLQEFLEEGDNTTTIGMVVREAHRKVDGGGEVAGLLIVNVMPGSPAATAGLRGVRTGAHSVLEGAAVAASLFFPPAIVAVALVDGTRVGESYDMVIAVDSVRVTNFLEFNDRMRQVEPGDIIYLSVVRNGKRMQIQVKVPGSIAPHSGLRTSSAATLGTATATHIP